MPKKKSTKGKKSKGGKGKKEGKQESKADKESDVEKAKANAALWEAKLDVTEQSRVQYREAARTLARANEELANQQYRTEKDTIDIIGFMRRQDAEKEQKIMSLEDQLKSQKAHAQEEQEKMVAEYTHQINELEELFKKRSSDFNMIEVELKNIKEFRKKKAQMEMELSSIKESMFLADKEHKESLARMEHKFFSEKARLEKEAEQRIAQLAERAHNEAIVQLDDASRTVFKENVRLNEALNFHMKELNDLGKLTTSLAKENATLMLNKGTAELLIMENAAQLKAQNEEISELKAKVATLEPALGLIAREFKWEKQDTQQRALVSTQASQVELGKLRALLAVQEKELGRIKRLAGSYAEQRAELESFFHEALFQVKQEIQASRLQYREEAQQAYHKRMSEARAGKQKFPPIRTFHKNPNSTNCVYSDMEDAERWTNIQGNKVDISDLTWEQKERVLRMLFAKMNGQKMRKPAQPLASSSPSEKNPDVAGITVEPSLVTFITQASVSDLPPNPSSLPNIHTT